MEEEKKFLLPFVDKARSGELVIIASIQEAFEHRIGKEVPASTITRLLDRHRWRKLEPEPHHPDEDKVAQEAFKKRFSKELGKAKGFPVAPRPLRVMFQDEARFGRLMEPKACWAPFPIRPRIAQGVVREYVYAYTAASPVDGRIDFTIQPFLDTENVNHFLKYLSSQHSNEEVVLVSLAGLVGAARHVTRSAAFCLLIALEMEFSGRGRFKTVVNSYTRSPG